MTATSPQPGRAARRRRRCAWLCSPSERPRRRRLLAAGSCDAARGLRPDFLLVVPGIRPAARRRRPETRQTPQAIEAGADYLVIGRPITGGLRPAPPRDPYWECMSVAVKICGLNSEEASQPRSPAAHASPASSSTHRARAISASRKPRLWSPAFRPALPASACSSIPTTRCSTACSQKCRSTWRSFSGETARARHRNQAAIRHQGDEGDQGRGRDRSGKRRGYFGVADWLMFDAKAPKDIGAARRQRTGVRLAIAARRNWPLPWMLSGGLNAGNLVEAARSRAPGSSTSPPGSKEARESRTRPRSAPSWPRAAI